MLLEKTEKKQVSLQKTVETVNTKIIGVKDPQNHVFLGSVFEDRKNKQHISRVSEIYVMLLAKTKKYK